MKSADADFIKRPFGASKSPPRDLRSLFISEGFLGIIGPRLQNFKRQSPSVQPFLRAAKTWIWSRGSIAFTVLREAEGEPTPSVGERLVGLGSRSFLLQVGRPVLCSLLHLSSIASWPP